MIYYSLLDISALTDEDADLMREKISKHFIGRTNLKRKESVAAKALLCHLLAHKFNLTDFYVDCDENEKPYIVDGGIYFNLSHSGKFVLCALGDENVGCDIQEIKPYNEKVVRRFFTESEFDFLRESTEKPLHFTRLWTLKESVLKFTGKGISGGLDSYDFSACCNKDSFRLCGKYFYAVEMPGYVMSICSENEEISQLDADIGDIFKRIS